MKSIALFLVIGLVSAEGTDAQSTNLRILIHSTASVTNEWGISGWAAAPNMTSHPDKWYGIVGPRYNTQDLWIEGMAGFVVENTVSTPLIDFRASYTKFAPLTAWTNIEFVDPTRIPSYYLYLQVDRWGLGNHFAFGCETEDTFASSGNNLSFGPHLVFSLNSMTLVAAQQIHNTGSGQTWIRIVLNL